MRGARNPVPENEIRGTDSLFEDFYIIGGSTKEVPDDSLSSQLRQIGRLTEGYELTSSLVLRPVGMGEEEPLSMKSLTTLIVRAVSEGLPQELLQEVSRGLASLKKTYYPERQEELDLLLTFISRYIRSSIRSFDSLREKVVGLLREEATRTRVLNETDLFMRTYLEILALLREPEALGFASKAQDGISILEKSTQRIETLLQEVPSRDAKDFRELYTGSHFLLQELKEKIQPLIRSPPVIQIRVHGTRRTLVVHPKVK